MTPLPIFFYNTTTLIISKTWVFMPLAPYTSDNLSKLFQQFCTTFFFLDFFLSSLSTWNFRAQVLSFVAAYNAFICLIDSQYWRRRWMCHHRRHRYLWQSDMFYLEVASLWRLSFIPQPSDRGRICLMCPPGRLMSKHFQFSWKFYTLRNLLRTAERHILFSSICYIVFQLKK